VGIQSDRPELLIVDETIEILRCGRTTVNRFLWSGVLPSIKINRWRLVRRVDLEEFVKAREYRPGEE
jgi:hypothetical protein